MSTDTLQKVEDYLRENPGAIATEIGISPVEANRLEKEGKITRVGKRQTGSRGRPPVEWALPESEKAEAAPTTLPTGAPKLVNADRIRDALTEEDRRKLDHVERAFAGQKVVLDPRSPHYGEWVDGIRDGEEGELDYKALAGTYKSIVNRYERKLRKDQSED